MEDLSTKSLVELSWTLVLGDTGGNCVWTHKKCGNQMPYEAAMCYIVARRSLKDKITELLSVTREQLDMLLLILIISKVLDLRKDEFVVTNIQTVSQLKR